MASASTPSVNERYRLAGRIKMASAITPSVNEPARAPMIKTQISGRMICSGISDVAIASVYSEKTHLKKLIMIIIIVITKNI